MNPASASAYTGTKRADTCPPSSRLTSIDSSATLTEKISRKKVATSCFAFSTPLTSGANSASNTAPTAKKIGRAAGRERVCQYVLISVGAVSLTKKNTIQKHQSARIAYKNT